MAFVTSLTHQQSLFSTDMWKLNIHLASCSNNTQAIGPTDGCPRAKDFVVHKRSRWTREDLFSSYVSHDRTMLTDP